MIYPRTLTTFQPTASQYIEEVGAEMYGRSETEEKIFAAHRSWVIYPFHQFQHLKSPSLPRRFLGKAPAVGNKRGREKEGERGKRGRKIVPASRFFNLFTSCQWKWWPAGGPPPTPLSWLCICLCKPHSWSHTLNKCNLYSIMNTTKKTDGTHGHSSHTDLSHKTSSHPWVYVAVLTSDRWSTWEVHVLSPAYGADVTAWLLRAIKHFRLIQSSLPDWSSHTLKKIRFQILT